jgi:hypothetical protein
MRRRSTLAAALLGAIACLCCAAEAGAGPCLIKSNFETVCLDATGARSSETGAGYLYVGIGAPADRIAPGYDWACGACHTSLPPETKSYVEAMHLDAFRRQAQPLGGTGRIAWSGGWTLQMRGERLCVARGAGAALACFPEGAFVFRGTARRVYMIHAPGPIRRIE